MHVVLTAKHDRWDGLPSHLQLSSSTAIREARALQSTLAAERKNREKVRKEGRIEGRI